MRLIRRILMTLLFSLSLGFGQESFRGEPTPEVNITGVLKDGKPQPGAPRRSSPQFKIQWETTILDQGRQVKMRQVEPPFFPETSSPKRQPKPALGKEELTALLEQQQETSPSPFLTVSATTYDRRLTRLQIWTYDGERKNAVEAWSNLDWNHLGGFSSFQAQGKEFRFLMLHGNSSLRQIRAARKKDPHLALPQIPNNLPPLAAQGPRYLVTAPAEASTTALDFLEAIHDLYAAQSEVLVQAYHGRQREKDIRAREQRANPSRPEDIEVFFWNNSGNRK